MEKILLGLNVHNPDKAATEFACYLARLTESKLTGVFLENIAGEAELVERADESGTFDEWAGDENAVNYKGKRTISNRSIGWFREKCEAEATRCLVHRKEGVPADELIAESRFADVLVVDSETSFEKRAEGSPTDFAKEVLKRSECPVIVAPEHFDGIEEIVFAYNNTASSAYAIRQFTYLFPQFRDRKATVLHVNETGEWQTRDRAALMELLADHYSNLRFVSLAGDPETVLFDHLLTKRNIFLVIGAYGRSAWSTLFKRSHAELLVKVIPQPIFIAHC